MIAEPTVTASVSLRQLQLTQHRLLCLFAEVCEAHGLRFWLTAGTLLGAVRHQGFIPWDDDVDVAMPRADFERLGALAREWEARGCFYQSERSERCYPFPFSKLLIERFPATAAENARIAMRQGCFIDVFPLDVCPRGERMGALFYAAHGFLTSVLKVKVNPEAACAFVKPLPRAIHRCAEVLPIAALKGLRRGLTKVVRRLCQGSGRLCTLAGAHGWPAETYEAAWFAKTRQGCFEGRSFPIPGGAEALLAHLYGADWRTPKRDPGRPSHFIIHDKERFHETCHHLRDL